MDKKEALIVLIKHTYLLTDNAKIVLLGKLDTLSVEDIDNLGRFLAMEKKFAIENSEKIISKLEEIKKQLNSMENTSK